jgi:hypothetical protein
MNIPIAWPRDAGTREKSSGEARIKMYKNYGLRVMAEPGDVAGTERAGGYTETAARRRSISARRTASGGSTAPVGSTSRSGGSITGRTARLFACAMTFYALHDTAT